jgi:hypothetical protein
MSNAFSTALTATIAAETTAGNIPVSPPTATYSPDYGSDIVCTDDTDALFSELPGDDPRLIGYAFWRYITSDRDSIPDAPGVGLDIRTLLRRGATAAEVASWPAQLKAQADNDDRITNVDVQMSTANGGQTYVIHVTGQTETGPFELTGLLTPNAAILQEILSP